MLTLVQNVIVCINNNLFLHDLDDGYLNCLQFFAIMNNVVMDNSLCLLVHMCKVFLRIGVTQSRIFS